MELEEAHDAQHHDKALKENSKHSVKMNTPNVKSFEKLPEIKGQRRSKLLCIKTTEQHI
jgi:hypothetical protein